MIIDAHVHLGYDSVFDCNASEESLIHGMDQYGIDISIVQPSLPRPYIEEHVRAHNDIADLSMRYPGRIFGMASINPHFYRNDFENELTRCVRELGFIGVKISPIGHAAHPATRDCLFVYECCRHLDIPVMIHTGDGLPFADPIAILPAVEAFPDVRFILAHAGTNLLFEQALYLGKKYDNVFLEPSWLNVLNTITAINVLGSSKIMFSSDAPENIPVELAKYKVAAKNKDLEMCLYGTAKAVFGLWG